MASTTVTVGSSVGLHARPAAIIADAAGEYDDEILISMEGADPEEDGVDAASSMLIMTLGAKHGDRVTVTGDDDAAVAQIAALIEQDLDQQG